jgi:hypothetical protein
MDRNNCKINEELFGNIVSKIKILHSLRSGYDHFFYHAQIIRSPIPFAMLWTGRLSASAPASSHGFTARVWPANKADTWFLRQHPVVLQLDFKDKITRPDR